MLLVYPAWVTGGTQTPWQAPMMLFGAACLAAAVWPRGGYRRSVLADPIFYVGGVFIVLLCIQWLNSGRVPTVDWDNMGPLIDGENYKWTYGPPPVSWLPSAIDKSDALEMVRWFFPAWALVLCLRAKVRDSSQARSVLTVLAASASLLALVSTGQFIAADLWQLVERPSDSYFVTSFGYANHAGAYFVLTLCLSLGLLIRETARTERRRKGVIVFLSACTALTFVGCHLSLGRAAVVMSWCVGAIAAFYVVFGRWNRLSGLERFNRALTVGTIVCLTAFAVVGFGRNYISYAFQPDYAAEENFDDERLGAAGDFVSEAAFDGRVEQRRVASGIIRDNLWFGAGGWSQRHLGIVYMPMEKRDLLSAEGRANTHCDPLQFMTEFGVVGNGLMIACAVIMLAELWRKRRSLFRPVPFFVCTGLALIFLYSFVDLPFRSPAILYAWLAVLVLLRAIIPHRASL